MNITRIDMFVVPSGIQIFKFAEDWHLDSRTRPVESYLSATPMDEMLRWLEGSGWIIRQWNEPGQVGARAFKDELHPIRTRTEIIRKRNQLDKVRFWGGILDLAFDM